MSDSIETFKQNFYDTYNQFLAPYLKNYEPIRKKHLRNAILWNIFFLVIYVYFIVVSLLENANILLLASITIIILIVTSIAIYACEKKYFEQKLKDDIMPHICRCFKNFHWYPKYPNNHKLFAQSGLLKDFDFVSEDDVFIGKYKNVNISVIEGYYDAGSGRNRHFVFNGLILKLDMNKDFKSHTILAPTSFLKKSSIPELKRTELEDIVFEKEYDVFTDDPVEARYILNPTFIEKIKNIKNIFKRKKLRCVFYKNNLLIAMPSMTGDLFSIGSLIRPAEDPKQFEELLNQFVSILELTEYLKLNEKAIL